MQNVLPTLAAGLIGFSLSACTQDTGEISRDAQPFDGIAESAEITLIGNEPFWGIDIMPASSDGASNEDGFTARYSDPENVDGTLFSVARFAGNNGAGFNGQLGGAAVQITLTPGDCNDTMSDRSYPYIATVLLGDRTLFGCAYTSDQPFTGEEMP